MRSRWRQVWREPRPVGAPPTGRADWLLAGAFEAAAALEVLVRPAAPGQPWVTLLAMAVIPALLWRRSHPLTACVVGFGAAGLLSVVQLLTGTAELGSSAMMFILVLLYALARWGSGREIVIGMPWVAAVVALGMYAADAGPADLIGGTLLLLLIATAAAVVRSRADLWQRQREEIRTQERLALARELHDTVAHHVSAIAVQAQAGTVVAGSQPDQVAPLLATIEDEAKRTLAEMRAMVRVLREDDDEAYAPLPGVRDLVTLSRTGPPPPVEVSLTGDVSDLPGPVDTALYRMAQEALTNCLRHARVPTLVTIAVTRAADQVRLRVTDDGQAQPGASVKPGLGLTGMAERAHLLGGTFTAGPASTGGWVVEAVLPVEVSS
ncbi:MAG: sensor histidine kinase [Actinobacteria bacterium]|nr:sensor histidine kinase [Actinomycetota bacterium]